MAKGATAAPPDLGAAIGEIATRLTETQAEVSVVEILDDLEKLGADVTAREVAQKLFDQPFLQVSPGVYARTINGVTQRTANMMGGSPLREVRTDLGEETPVSEVSEDPEEDQTESGLSANGELPDPVTDPVPDPPASVPPPPAPKSRKKKAEPAAAADPAPLGLNPAEVQEAAESVTFVPEEPVIPAPPAPPEFASLASADLAKALRADLKAVEKNFSERGSPPKALQKALLAGLAAKGAAAPALLAMTQALRAVRDNFGSRTRTPLDLFERICWTVEEAEAALSLSSGKSVNIWVALAVTAERKGLPVRAVQYWTILREESKAKGAQTDWEEFQDARLSGLPLSNFTRVDAADLVPGDEVEVCFPADRYPELLHPPRAVVVHEVRADAINFSFPERPGTQVALRWTQEPVVFLKETVDGRDVAPYTAPETEKAAKTRKAGPKAAGKPPVAPKAPRAAAGTVGAPVPSRRHKNADKSGDEDYEAALAAARGRAALVHDRTRLFRELQREYGLDRAAVAAALGREPGGKGLGKLTAAEIKTLFNALGFEKKAG